MAMDHKLPPLVDGEHLALAAGVTRINLSESRMRPLRDPAALPDSTSKRPQPTETPRYKLTDRTVVPSRSVVDTQAHRNLKVSTDAPSPGTVSTGLDSPPASALASPQSEVMAPPAASSLMGGFAADMQARILALQASRPRRQSTSSRGSASRSPSNAPSRNSSTASLSSSSTIDASEVAASSPKLAAMPVNDASVAVVTSANTSGVVSPGGQAVNIQTSAVGVISGALPSGVPSGALAFARSNSNRSLKRTTSLSERRGVKLNPGSLRDASEPTPTLREGIATTSISSHSAAAMPAQASMPQARASPLSQSHRRQGSASSFKIPETHAASAIAAARRPKLSLRDTQSAGVLGVPNRVPQAVKTQNNIFSAYKKYIDIETGSLNFAGKAVLHSNGIDFSSGTSFRITLDELEPVSELGAGNYGTVTKVLHKPTNVSMAMKEIRLELEEANFQQIIMELDVLHRCQLSHIVEFYGAFFVESAVYVCMEYMDGGSINQIYESGIPEKQLAHITRSVIHALRQLKEDHNIIHRDVKPTNILCSTSGIVKLCDFGVSGNLVSSIAKTNIGCHAYMAPERIRTNASTQSATYTVESDVWSLGLSIIEMSEGLYPYPPESYSNIFSQLSAIVDGEAPRLDPARFSPEACSFVQLCLDKNPRSRPTYSQLLKHPWLAEQESGIEDMARLVRERLEQNRALKRQPA